MKLNGTVVIWAAALVSACTRIQPSTKPAPSRPPGTEPTQPPSPPRPPAPAVPSRVPSGGPWIFTYAPGTYTYSIITQADITPVLGNTENRQVLPQTGTTTVAISATGDMQVLSPAVGAVTVCDSSATLLARAQQLIPKLPRQLAVGDRWRDSTTTTGCRGTIPAESSVISNYVVTGDTSVSSAIVLDVHRTDSLSANGEGTEGQHRILVTATGTGTVDIFLDIATGRLIGSHGLQTSLVNVTTSGKMTQFIQHVTETVKIAGTP